MKRDRTVASGSTIEGGSAILISPSCVQETGSGTDVLSAEFLKIANSCIGVIFPSCSESGGGGVIVCMHAGLIPVVSYETSVDTGDFGVTLKDCSIDTIQEAVQMVASWPKNELEVRSRKAWEYARTNHTRERFAEGYRKTIEKIISLKLSR
jgi:glycosyltransferase involved in cell wall biosynthesis